jgi:OOP family OmpA-OmpF porin
MTPSDAAGVLAAAVEIFGADRVTDGVVADESAARPTWIGSLPAAIASLRFVAEPGLAVDGSSLTLAGEISSEARREQILGAFAGLGLPIADGLGIAAPPAPERAAELQEALDAAVADATIRFETGSSTIDPVSAPLLGSVARLLIAVPGARIEIAGHTDSEGPAEGNLELSQRRADAVAAYLVDLGVDPVQVAAVGYGEERPIADNSTEAGRGANRRIEFSVEGSE